MEAFAQVLSFEHHQFQAGTIDFEMKFQILFQDDPLAYHHLQLLSGNKPMHQYRTPLSHHCHDPSGFCGVNIGVLFGVCILHFVANISIISSVIWSISFPFPSKLELLLCSCLDSLDRALSLCK